MLTGSRRVCTQVPADCRVVALKSLTLQLDQALLTGESMEVNKQTNAGSEPAVPINEKHNMLFSGTAVKKGQCLAVVNSIGTSTEIGCVPSSLHGAQTWAQLCAAVHGDGTQRGRGAAAVNP
jgi:Ca2+-transporting ATPase